MDYSNYFDLKMQKLKFNTNKIQQFYGINLQNGQINIKIDNLTWLNKFDKETPYTTFKRGVFWQYICPEKMKEKDTKIRKY